MWCISRHHYNRPIHNLRRIANAGFYLEPAHYLDRGRQAVKERGCPLRAKREEYELRRRKACVARSEPRDRVFH